MAERRPDKTDSWHTQERDYKLKIGELIRAAGRSPEEFTFRPRKKNGLIVMGLCHRITKEVFEFGLGCERSVPGNRLSKTESLPSYERAVPWGAGFVLGHTVESAFTAWLSSLNRWLAKLEHYWSTPDLWSIDVKKPQLLQIQDALHEEDRPFTDNERESLHQRLDELKKAISDTQRFNADQFADLKGRLDRLDELGKVFGRRDWLTFLMGTIMNLGIA